jgi:hypothetical protein
MLKGLGLFIEGVRGGLFIKPALRRKKVKTRAPSKVKLKGEIERWKVVERLKMGFPLDRWVGDVDSGSLRHIHHHGFMFHQPGAEGFEVVRLFKRLKTGLLLHRKQVL